MVSLWPWSRSDDSPASFEKTLSAVSKKINDTSARLDVRRQRARRAKALWTLYSSFAYLLCFVLEALVIGWQNWGAVEVSGLAGSPVVIYLVRLGLDTYYTQRIGSLQRHLTALQAEREQTINKLKKATRYDSTQELLDKYGGKERKSEAANKPKSAKPQQPQPQRTNVPPPPTANIPGRNPQNLSPLPQQGAGPEPWGDPARGPPQQQGRQGPPPGALAQAPASQAFAQPPPAYAAAPSAPAWYDRVLDVLLGEDETAARNRLALVCGSCRLVNGLAPPGAKTLEDVGRWRCSQCGAMNGEHSADAKVAKQIAEAADLSEEEVLRGMVSAKDGSDGGESDVTVYSDEEEHDGKAENDKENNTQEDAHDTAKTRRSVRQRKTRKS